MISATPAPPQRYTFAGVQALKPGVGKDGTVVAKELEQVYGDLHRAGAVFACQRLKDVDPEVDKLRFDVIREIVAPQQVFDELDQSGGKASRTISAWRNVFALLPLLLTWAALGWASLAYHQQLSAQPTLIGTPFLDLWQTGFGSRMALTFAGTAIIDLSLLTVLVALTAFLHVKEGREQRAASDIVGRLNAALTSLAITMQAHEKKVKKADLESVADEISTTLSRVEASMNAIVAANEKVVNSASASIDKAKEGIETFVSGISTQVYATLETMKQGYQTFITKQNASAAGTFDVAREKTERLFVDRVAPTIESFSRTADEYVRSAGKLTNAADTLNLSATTLGDTAGEIHGDLLSLNTNIQTVGTEAGGMRDAADGVIANNAAMAEMARQANLASGNLARVSQQLEKTTRELMDAASTLAAAAGSVPVGSGPPPKRRGFGPFRF